MLDTELMSHQFKKVNMKVVKHFKREMLTKSEIAENPSKYLYYVEGKATHTETGETLIIYYSLEDGQMYARPIEMFLSKVDNIKYPDVKQKFRFEPI